MKFQLIFFIFFSQTICAERQEVLRFSFLEEEVNAYVGSQDYNQAHELAIKRQRMAIRAGLEAGEVLAPYPEFSDPYFVPAPITVVTQADLHLQNSYSITGKAAHCFLTLCNEMQDHGPDFGKIYFQEALKYMKEKFEDIKANLECALGYINYWVDNSVCRKTEKSKKLVQLVDEQKRAIGNIQTLTKQDCMLHREYLAHMYTIFLKQNRDAVEYMDAYNRECKAVAKK